MCAWLSKIGVPPGTPLSEGRSMINIPSQQPSGRRDADRASVLLSRRGVLLGASGILAGAVLLDGCGTSASNDTSSKPVRGGTLKIGVVGSGTLEQLAPSVEGPSTIVRAEQLYDRLFDLGDDLQTLKPKLALSARPNRQGTLWTFKLRQGVTWHDGKPFTADDVVFSIKGWGDKDSYTYGALNDVIDYKNVRKVSKDTVEVPLLKASGQFPSLLTGNMSFAMRQAGSTLKALAVKPIGTGPFKYKSFKPGVQSVFVANKDYWIHDGPYLDQVVVNSSFSDPTAMVNALAGGEIDAATLLPPLAAKAAESSGQFKVLKAKPSNANIMYMDVTSPPFNDVRVRQAMRLLTDRQAMVDGALAGYGEPANDLLGAGSKYFAGDLTRERDVDKAKSLLKAAGQSDLKIPITTSKAFPGAVEAATLLSQQAKDAGVDVKVNVIAASNYFSSTAGFPWQFGQDYTFPQASLDAWYRLFFVQYNESKWDTPKDKALQSALAEVDPTKAAEKWAVAQKEHFDIGPVLVWANSNIIDGIGNKVRGVPASPVGGLNNYRVVDAWKV